MPVHFAPPHAASSPGSARLTLLEPATAAAPAAALLERIARGSGQVPNMFRVAAHSPAALQSLWGSFAALAGGVLPVALRERIALAISARNACDYCLDVHTRLARQAGLPDDELDAARRGESADPQAAMAVRFALELLTKRGAVSADEVGAMRAAGFSDGALVEIVAHVALNVFANHVNIAFDVPLDTPPSRPDLLP